MSKAVKEEGWGTKDAGRRCFIIAEAGVNHNGSLDCAVRLVDAAAEAGADAVKFQSFITSEIVTSAAAKARYQEVATGTGGSQADMLRKLELSSLDILDLKVHAEAAGIKFLSTPFDIRSARALRDAGVACMKISSGCITYSGLLREVGSYGLPVILSTGMADMDEVGAAVADLDCSGCRNIVLLQCVTDYPADIKTVNLRAMLSMGRVFGLPYGYSDHTEGDEAVLAAVALGASVIEKHITLDTASEGPDHASSMMPADFRKMVERIRNVEAALGDGRKTPTQSELANRNACRYSLVAARTIRKGSKLTGADITAKRPGSGIAPSLIDRLTGCTAREEIQQDELLSWEMLECR